ncbi:MAG: hypothetical protein WDM92_14495 [Caulobacteraceae bacterium]
MGGVEEEGAEFRRPAAAFEGLARFRTFGPDGPLYEVLGVGPNTVRVHVFDNGEEFDYRLDRAINDPVAN